MTAVRWLGLLSTVLLASAGCGLSTDVENWRIDGEIRRVTVETASGDIRLLAGPGEGAEVEALLAWEGERPELRVDYRGGELVVSSPCLDRVGACEASFTLIVPADVDGELRTRDGDVYLESDFYPVVALSQEGEVHRP